jgi:hypothetical protein
MFVEPCVQIPPKSFVFAVTPWMVSPSRTNPDVTGFLNAIR